MIKINYPPYTPKIKQSADKELIFDEVRKLWVMLTPEEWVRQNFLQYLIQVKEYPSTLIAIEKEIQLGELTKRFDMVVYDKDTKPWMIIECKEMNVGLSPAVFDQALRYNQVLKVPFLVITNGTNTVAYSIGNELVELLELPTWKIEH